LQLSFFVFEAMPKNKKRLILNILLAALFFFILTGGSLYICAAEIYYSVLADLPEPTPEAMASLPESSRIYDRYGELLYEVHGDVKRRFVPLSEIPKALQDATIAIEDKNFYKHGGFDVLSIARAYYKNLKNQEIKQGASTITQQLARIIFLKRDRVYSRKIKELILAIQIEKRYSKDEILEMYLNNIPYGANAYGVAAASEIYYGKQVRELDFMECAYLAALPKAPSNYSPFGANQNALEQRARDVILAMHKTGFLLDYEKNYYLGQAKSEFTPAPVLIKAPHFVFYILEEIADKYGEAFVREGGLDIYTSLDLSWQKQAEEIVNEWGMINEKKYRADNAALVALDPQNGQIMAMVGSRDYFRPHDGNFNAATSPRQPGSSFKPYVYATAIANGLMPNSLLFDSRTNFAFANYGVDYIPRNYSGKHYGLVTVRKALAGSLNVPAVKVLVGVGIDRVIDLAEDLGITSLGNRKRFGPSLALGGGEVKLLEHTAGLAVFGNEGKRLPFAPILKITDKSKNTLYEWQPSKADQVVAPDVAFWINDILSDTQARQYIFGQNNKLKISDRQVAAKTGTSQDFRDAWTLGYTPNLAVGVWVGNSDNSSMKNGADGSVVAAPIWHDFMEKTLANLPKTQFKRPADLIDPPPAKYPERLVGEKPAVATKDFAALKSVLE